MNADSINLQFASIRHGEEVVSASCEGLLNSHIPPSGTPWYGDLVKELEALQVLADEWQKKEVVTLESSVLPAIQTCAKGFTKARDNIENLFAACEDNKAENQPKLVSALQELTVPVTDTSNQVGAYKQQLKDWEQRFEQAHQSMSDTIGAIQSGASMLSSQIKTISHLITELSEEIKKDKSAISKAKSKKDGDIVKTIFGFILGAATGGAGTILAGIGVASIAEGEAKIKELESKVKSYQGKISGYLANMMQDQVQLVTLQALTLPTSNILNDVAEVESSVDDIRVSWNLFSQELENVIQKISSAQNASDIIVEKAWFLAACKEWEEIANQTN